MLLAEDQLDSVSKIDEEFELLKVEQLIVNFDGRDVLYRKEDLQELALAYCFTVHKSQGSEFPNVILPISRNCLMLMNKNLLYTAVTRASKTLCILGDLEFFEQGLKISPNRRYTFLSELLNSELTVENSQ